MIYSKNAAQNGGTIFELVASLVIILVLISVFGIYAGKLVTEAKEVALRNELSNLRLALEVYRVRNGQIPESLAQLYQRRDYFVNIDRRGEGNVLLDPFGGKYVYMKDVGHIVSGTDKYRQW